MAESNAFAEAPPTPELFIARVRRELDAAYADTDVPPAEIDRAAVAAVDDARAAFILNPTEELLLEALAARLARELS